MGRKKQVVVIEGAPTDTMTKMAVVLRQHGYETVLISLTSIEGRDFLKKGYDKIISFGFKYFKINLSSLPKIIFHGIKKFLDISKASFEIKKLNPYVVIGRATPNWLCFLALKYFRNSPFVYFPFDIRSFCYENREEALKAGIPKFEIASERYCFKNADGIIHKGSEEELKNLNEKVLEEKVKIKCPTIFFFPYCLKELMVNPEKKEKLSYKDGNIHIVYVGHMPLDKDFFEGIKRITQSKVYFHIYSKTVGLTKEEDSMRLKEKSRDVLGNKFLFVHEPVSPKILAKEISKYDFGVYSYTVAEEKFFETATGNKLAVYLEAGLPIICPRGYKSASEILERHEVGITVSPSQYNQLKSILQRKDLEKLRKNVLKARIKLSMQQNFPRLKKFFGQVVKYKKIS